MIYWVIRHKATGELMPQMKRTRGYTHWNPSGKELLDNYTHRNIMGIPRLFDRLGSANKAAKLWSSMPNACYTWSGEDNDPELKYREDGRKLEDIEVVKVDLTFPDDNREET